MTEIVRVMCENGHIFELGVLGENFTPDEDLVACFSWCDQMITKPEHANLVLECGARIIWRRKPIKDRPKMRVFRNAKQRQQLDLFLDVSPEKSTT